MPEDVGGVGHGQDVVIIKKVVKGGHGHHGGAWKVAYADMVTALMALFIVLWILGQSEEVKQNVAGYFRDPIGFQEGGASAAIEGGGAQAEASPIEAEIPAPAPAPPPPQAAAPAEAEPWRERASAIRQALEKLPTFETYREQVDVALTEDGLRITLLESNETPLFESGSTQLNRDAHEFLATIAGEIRQLENHIVIEGHTDSRPFDPSARMTNWELSTGRAHTARNVLEASGVGADRTYEVRGLADRQLYVAEDPTDSRNRRVAITLLSDAAYTERAGGAHASAESAQAAQ